MPPNTSCVWSLGDTRLAWAFGVENRQATTVLPCIQAAFEDLRSLTGGSRPAILRLHSDKTKEFLSPVIKAYLLQQGVRQTVNSGCDPAGNGLAERWIGSVKLSHCLVADDSHRNIGPMHVDGWHTFTLIESQRLQLTRPFPILVMLLWSIKL